MIENNLREGWKGAQRKSTPRFGAVRLTRGEKLLRNFSQYCRVEKFPLCLLPQ